jgi:Glycosyltransferase family 87
MVCSPSAARRRSAACEARRKRLGITGLISVIPLALLTTFSVLLLVKAVSGGVLFQMDFNGGLYLAGDRIFHGLSPNLTHALAVQAAIVRAGGTIKPVVSPRYPAPLLVAAAPLSLLPLWLADVLFMIVSAAAVVGALRLLGIRDWRCIAVAGVSWPSVEGAWLGNVSPLILLGAAVAWRFRSRLWPAAAAVASVVAAKVFLWPLGVWLLATRRFRTLALAILTALVVAIVGWAVIGFADLAEYPHILMNVASISEGRGCSLVATLMSVGVSPGVARVVALFCGVGLMGVAFRLARLPDGDRRAFGLIVAAGVIATPVVWAHYLVLLFVPIALLAPELSAIWFLPMLAGFVPGPVAHPQLWVSMPALALELFVVCWVCSPFLVRRAPHVEPAERRQDELPSAQMAAHSFAA